MECRLDDITVHYESFGADPPLIWLPGWPDFRWEPADYLEPARDLETGVFPRHEPE